RGAAGDRPREAGGADGRGDRGTARFPGLAGRARNIRVHRPVGENPLIHTAGLARSGIMHRAALVVALATLPACASPRGGILGARALYDFGTVEQGASVQHQFPLKNEGRSWVRLEAPVSSCGCTVTDVDGKLLRPGQVHRVGVWLETRALSGKSTKPATPRTTAPRTPTIQLALTGTVLTDVRVTPSRVYLGCIWGGDPARHEIVVSAGRPGKSEY